MKLTSEIQTKLFLDLEQHLGQFRALRDVLDARVAHKTQQIQHKIGRFSQPIIGLSREINKCMTKYVHVQNALSPDSRMS
jgi:hypothetical protein